MSCLTLNFQVEGQPWDLFFISWNLFSNRRYQTQVFMTYTTRDIIECVTSCLTLNFKVKGQGHNINIFMLNFAYEKSHEESYWISCVSYQIYRGPSVPCMSTVNTRGIHFFHMSNTDEAKWKPMCFKCDSYQKWNIHFIHQQLVFHS